jgi:Zn-dependent M28 family amino/carboxypeptidase
MSRKFFALPLLLIGVPLVAQGATKAAKLPVVPIAISAIKEADLKRDLYAMAGPEMRGREAGTLDEMRASVWVADQMRAIGLKPLGDMGTYYQWWNMRRTRISATNTLIQIGGKPFVLWKDIAPTTNTAIETMAQTVFVGDGKDTTIDVRGKIAVATLVPNVAGIRSTTNTYDYNYTRAALTPMTNALTRRGAAGIIIVADSIAELAFDGIGRIQSRGTYDVVGGAPRGGVRPAGAAAAGRTGGAAAPAAVAVLLAHRSALNDLRTNGQTVDIKLHTETFEYPSANIVGVIPGTDPKLKNEYVLFSSHQDHDGVRYVVNGDSIWAGADDNASVSVALLGIARAFVKQPGKRPALFVFHGAEERGLLGSRYETAHPVVPLDQIIAVINGDMIGRNHPDTAALLGSQPPHRNSTDLVQAALAANAVTGKFVVDSTWDRPTHPEGWYFRSDHEPYARVNVPALMFSTNLHPDYHTPRDIPQNINYPKLTRMTKWMYMTGWIVANAPKRPGIDPGFKLER